MNAAEASMSFVLRLLIVVGALTYFALRVDGREPEQALAAAKSSMNVERLRADAQALVGGAAERLAREAAAREVARFAAPPTGGATPISPSRRASAQASPQR